MGAVLGPAGSWRGWPAGVSAGGVLSGRAPVGSDRWMVGGVDGADARSGGAAAAARVSTPAVVTICREDTGRIPGLRWTGGGVGRRVVEDVEGDSAGWLCSLSSKSEGKGPGAGWRLTLAERATGVNTGLMGGRTSSSPSPCSGLGDSMAYFLS